MAGGIRDGHCKDGRAGGDMEERDRFYPHICKSILLLLKITTDIEKVGLFVAIITAFQVPVSQNLSANPADLTNVILGNLTSIVYEIALLNGMKVPVSLPQPVPFKPARSDEIVTFLWYSALILSVRTREIVSDWR